MKKTMQRKYARLIARVGANIQKGQTVRLFIAVDQSEFAQIMVDECYKAGASRVDIDWTCQPMAKLHYRYRTLKSLSTVQKWEEEKLKLMTEELPCRIYIASDDPDGLKGINQTKMRKASMARYPILKPYREAIDNRHQWTIAAVPSYAWAKKVFPGLKKNQAYEKLWQSILAAVRVTEDNDPVEAWREHNESFNKRKNWLNEHRFERLTYRSANGTDFSVELIPQGRWNGGGDTTLQGVFFNPNMPTEEVFTSPMKGKAEGTLVSTKPLSYEGQLIENFSLIFRDGKVADVKAQKGEALLRSMISRDEGAAMLGELALIPCDSPINNSGILYYETLFDENASCHVALGKGFNDCIEGFENMTNDECKALGINDSMIHVDFMIGAPDMEITGYKDGVATPIFKNGEWAF